MGRAWIGVDIGKDFHWALAIDETGREIFSRRVENEQGDIEALIEQAFVLGCDLVWGVDMSHGPVALLVASLLAAGQEVVFVPGLMVNRCRGAFVGANKTDALDARVIAENARMRHVKATVECPRRLDTTCGGVPALRRIVAWACRRSWKRTPARPHVPTTARNRPVSRAADVALFASRGPVSRSARAPADPACS